MHYNISSIIKPTQNLKHGMESARKPAVNDLLFTTNTLRVVTWFNISLGGVNAHHNLSAHGPGPNTDISLN
jgi:hypothetical protein